MTRTRLEICLLMLLLCSACNTRPKSQVPSAVDQNPWKLGQSTHLRVQVQRLAEVPNSGLQLPVVSPDGQWIAYLDRNTHQPLELDALFTGRGLDSVGLYIQPIAPGSSARMVHVSGAAWPAFSPDSKKLLFVAYNQAGQCNLAIHDLSGASTRLLASPGPHAIMPSFSPSGKEFAVVNFDPQTQSSRLHLVHADSGKILQTCPSRSPQPRQLWPQWTADGGIVFLLGYSGQTWLARWTPGKSDPQKLAQVHMSDSRMGTYQAFAGLGRPLSPDDGHFAYYDSAADRLVLLNLDDGQRVNLPVTARAGCWLTCGQFVAAVKEELRLFDIPPTSPALLMRQGPWLPRSGNPTTGELILLTRADRPGMFSLVRMKVIAEK